ncbi:MAG TPA: ABC transporter substrate-binding protein [Terriglobales bacterium]|nr:ABC transporter substrate-binding protein [Terriglobales bacterium]
MTTSAVKKAVFAVLVIVLYFSPVCAQEKIAFPVAASTKTAGYSPLWAGVKQGFFAQEGLNVQPVVIRGSDRSIQALVGGSVYAALLAPDAPMVAADRGLDATIIAGNTQRLAHWIVGGKTYKTFDDLRGATVGTISLTAGTGLVLRHVLRARGLEYPRDYKLLIIGGTPQLFTALISNQIAAAPLALPYNFAAEELGYHAIGSFMEVFPNFQLTVLAGSRAWSEKNRRLQVRFLKGWVHAIRWLQDNEGLATEFMVKEFGFKPAHAGKAWQYYAGNKAWDYDGRVNLDGMKAVIQMAAEQNQIKGPLPSPAKYIEDSYLNEALRELRAAK